ncbi:ribbon-helix-helix protein, CopG family [Geodermatophilus sp. URMC 63]
MHTHLTDDEANLVEELAQADGRSVSAFIRRALLRHTSYQQSAAKAKLSSAELCSARMSRLGSSGRSERQTHN